MTDLFEHEGKTLFTAAGIPVPRSTLVRSPADAVSAAKDIGYPLVVKAQVLSGGRGKAGGIRRVCHADDLAQVAGDILSLCINGKAVVSLLLEESLDLARELYLAVALDRTARRPVLLFSTQGGVDVEQGAAAGRQGMVRVPIDPLLGLRDYQVRTVSAASGFRGELERAMDQTVRRLWELYLSCDATLAEINPLGLVRTADGEPGTGALVALDAKVSLDDNARFRSSARPGLAAPDGPEDRAREAGLSYVRLEGDIGVLGNGAGLVMTLIDLIARAGGRAANFLDMGGGASRDRIEKALDILLDDERVKVLLVVIFGGITRCDEVTRGLVSALEDRASVPPVVVQLDGTNAALAAQVLAERENPDIIATEDLSQAVRRAAKIAAQGIAPRPGRDLDRSATANRSVAS